MVLVAYEGGTERFHLYPVMCPFLRLIWNYDQSFGNHYLHNIGK